MCDYTNDKNNVLSQSVTMYKYKSPTDKTKVLVKKYPIDFIPNEELASRRRPSRPRPRQRLADPADASVRRAAVLKTTRGMAMTTSLIIDADSHVTEPPDVWTARVPARLRDDVPHVERIDGADIWMLQGNRIGMLGVMAPAGWPGFPPEYPPTLDDCHPAAADAHERLRYLDEAGIWAQVLYPNVGASGARTSSP